MGEASASCSRRHSARLARIRAEVVELRALSVEVPRDSADAPILATLAAANAYVLVTGDRDLLALRANYRIETPAEFVRRL